MIPAIDRPPLLRDAAAAVVGSQQHPQATLYVVATPIGNLADLSLRAVHVLHLVDAVACEDTRVSARLLQWMGLSKPLLAVHEHNEREAAVTVIERLQRGERIALISDAGTPAISDPGARLVQAVQDAGLRCLPIPGASAAVTALSVAGDVHATGFRFVGFVPPKGAAREAALKALLDPAHASSSQLLFEAPHRIASLLRSLATLAGDRRLTIARELTKQFEEIATMPAAATPAWLQHEPTRERGEFVLVLHAVHPQADETAVDASTAHDALLLALMDARPLREAVALAAEATGASRNLLYPRALALRDAARPDDV